MTESTHEGDARARKRFEAFEGTGGLVVLKLVGHTRNVVATIDEIANVDTNGLKRVLVKATDSKTKKRFHVYASSVLAVMEFLTEKKTLN